MASNRTPRAKRTKPQNENEPVTSSITMNLADTLVAEIDAEARKEERSGIKLTRSNMVRMLLTEALKQRSVQRSKQHPAP